MSNALIPAAGGREENEKDRTPLHHPGDEARRPWYCQWGGRRERHQHRTGLDRHVSLDSLAQCRNETITALRHGLHISWRTGLVSQRFSQFLDGVVEAFVKIDESVGGPN